MASVTYDRVTKAFDDAVAVDGLELDIADGEFLVLVGPSGCGKSTALRMLAGLEEITGGEIRIGDRVVNDVAPADRDVAMVFQSYALYPHMTVYDNLAFGLRNQKVPKDEIDRRVREAAQILDMGDLIKRKPKQLSGGQRQRVALGRAIVREPKAFLMDEPLSNLDAALRVQTRAEILKLQQRLGTTTIYVTHDQVEAMTMGDRIAVLRGGVLQQVGTPQELYTGPRNVFVARFIGSPAMNVVEVEATSDGGHDVLTSKGFAIELPQGTLSRVKRDSDDGLVVGFRPEHLELTGADVASGRARIPAVVDVVEYLGDEQLVHLHAGEIDLMAKLPVDAGRVDIGREVALAVPLDKLHLFDRKTERSVTPA
jgi:multiple sugar transport system ATP-binding protein